MPCWSPKHCKIASKLSKNPGLSTHYYEQTDGQTDRQTDKR